MRRDLQRFSNKYKFESNVKGAQLKLAATNSKTTPTAARFDGPEPAATKSKAVATANSKADSTATATAKSRRDAGATMPWRLHVRRLNCRGRGRVRFRDRRGTGKAFPELCTYLENPRV